MARGPDRLFRAVAVAPAKEILNGDLRYINLSKGEEWAGGRSISRAEDDQVANPRAYVHPYLNTALSTVN